LWGGTSWALKDATCWGGGYQSTKARKVRGWGPLKTCDSFAGDQPKERTSKNTTKRVECGERRGETFLCSTRNHARPGRKANHRLTHRHATRRMAANNGTAVRRTRGNSFGSTMCSKLLGGHNKQLLEKGKKREEPKKKKNKRGRG